MRFVAMVAQIRKGKPNYTWREGEAKCDFPVYDKYVLLTNVKDKNGVVYPDFIQPFNKTISQVEERFYVGNVIEFDASYTNNKISRMRNICGKQASWVGAIDENGFLASGEVPQIPDKDSCYFCSYRRKCNKIFC